MKLLFIFSLICFFFVIEAQEEEFTFEGTELWIEESNFIYQGEVLYEMLNLEDFVNSEALQESLAFGLDFANDWGIAEGFLSGETEWQLEELNFIQQPQGNETVHYFDVTLRNDQGELESLIFAVYQIPGTEEREGFDPYFIDPIIISENGANFLDRTWDKSYTWQEFNNNEDNAKNEFFFGINNILQTAVSEGALANDRYYVGTLYSAAIDRGDDETYYFFDVYFNTESAGFVEALYTVRVQGDVREVEKYVLFPVG